MWYKYTEEMQNTAVRMVQVLICHSEQVYCSEKQRKGQLSEKYWVQKESISLNCNIRIEDSPIVTYALQISGLILVSLCQLSVKCV